MSHGKLYMKLMNSRKWRETRIAVLRQHPLCQWCEAKGLIVPAREIHHIVEVESGRTEPEVRDLCFRMSNLVALCHECHASYHKSMRYHSKEVIKQRNIQRQAAWKDQIIRRFTYDRTKEGQQVTDMDSHQDR